MLSLLCIVEFVSYAFFVISVVDFVRVDFIKVDLIVVDFMKS